MNLTFDEITCSYRYPQCTPELRTCGYEDCGWELKDYMRKLEQLHRDNINISHKELLHRASLRMELLRSMRNG